MSYQATSGERRKDSVAEYFLHKKGMKTSANGQADVKKVGNKPVLAGAFLDRFSTTKLSCRYNVVLFLNVCSNFNDRT